MLAWFLIAKRPEGGEPEAAPTGIRPDPVTGEPDRALAGNVAD